MKKILGSLSDEEDSWKKFSRGFSGRVEIFCLRPTRFNTLGSILASGMIRNMSK